jgi:NAD(P)H-flavin reductase
VRVDRTIAPFGRRRATVLSRDAFGAYVVLRCLDSGGPAPDPGQFYMLSAARRWGGGAGERPFLPRAFSVMRAVRETGPAGPESAPVRETLAERSKVAPERETDQKSAPVPVELQFLLEAVGPGTARLCELRAGDELLIVGPLGRGFTPPAEGRRPLLVGGGVGIAPLAIWQDALGPEARVLLGFRDGAHAEGAALLDGGQIATDDGSVGHHGLVTDLLADELEADPQVTVYACGPPAMLESVRALCEHTFVPAQLALESGMACGYGACFGCVVATKSGYVRLCVDGPVLDASELETALTPGAGH